MAVSAAPIVGEGIRQGLSPAVLQDKSDDADPWATEFKSIEKLLTTYIKPLQ